MTQFHHVRKYTLTSFYTIMEIEEVNPRGGKTIAMEDIEPWLLNQLTVGDFFTRRVGVARCSDEENYNKKTGRELAESRMKPVVLTVLAKNDFGSIVVAALKDEKGNVYGLELKKGAKSVHFISYE